MQKGKKIKKILNYSCTKFLFRLNKDIVLYSYNGEDYYVKGVTEDRHFSVSSKSNTGLCN